LPQTPEKEDMMAKIVASRSKSPLPKRTSTLEPKARTANRKIGSSYATSSPTEEKDSAKPRREATFRDPTRDNKEK